MGPVTPAALPTCSWIESTRAASVTPSSVAIAITVPTGIGAGTSR